MFDVPPGHNINEAAMKTILIKEPLVYGYQDEKHFFSWLENVPALHEMKRTSQGLALTIATPIDDDSLADLVGLLSRYRVDRTSLKAFSTAKKQKWFASSRTYWYRAVFKNESPANARSARAPVHPELVASP